MNTNQRHTSNSSGLLTIDRLRTLDGDARDFTHARFAWVARGASERPAVLAVVPRATIGLALVLDDRSSEVPAGSPAWPVLEAIRDDARLSSRTLEPIALAIGKLRATVDAGLVRAGLVVIDQPIFTRLSSDAHRLVGAIVALTACARMPTLRLASSAWCSGLDESPKPRALAQSRLGVTTPDDETATAALLARWAWGGPIVRGKAVRSPAGTRRAA